MNFQEHAARRFAQIQKGQLAIEQKEQQIRDAKAAVKELEDELRGLWQELRAAARDEGELPLLDMMEDPKSGKAN